MPLWPPSVYLSYFLIIEFVFVYVIVNVDDENLLLFEIMILFDKFLSVHIILPFAISIFCIKIKIVHR